MPDDNIFTNDQAAPAPSSPVTESTATSNDASYVTPTELDQRFVDLENRFSESMKQFGQQVAGAIQQPQPSSEPAQPTETPEETTDQYVARIAKTAIKDDMGVTTETIQQDLIQDRFQELKAEFDGELGDGKFEELIQNDLTTAVKSLPPQLRSSRSHLTMLMRGLKGGIPVDKLTELRTETVKSREEASAPRMLTGTGLPRPRGQKVSQEEKDFIQALNKSGDPYTMEEYVRDRDSGMTEEEYMAVILKEQSDGRA